MNIQGSRKQQIIQLRTQPAEDGALQNTPIGDGSYPALSEEVLTEEAALVSNGCISCDSCVFGLAHSSVDGR